MSYKATVINVMIASPSDVPQERLIARDVIAEWNSIHAKDKQVVLTPIGWETHSVPETGDRPQAIINGQLLKDADLLIAMFWTRIGTPTGVARSGTVEEIEEHIRQGKSAMFYFSSAPVRPDSVNNDQYSAVIGFKETLKAKGLFEEYESLSEFRAKLARQLAQKVILRFQAARPSSNEPNRHILSTATPFPKAENPVPAISPDAQDLLIEASKDPRAVILNLQSLDGCTVQTNGRDFAERGNARSEAHWRGVVKELRTRGLIEDRAGRGEVFFVTGNGFSVAEWLQTH